MQWPLQILRRKLVRNNIRTRLHIEVRFRRNLDITSSTEHRGRVPRILGQRHLQGKWAIRKWRRLEAVGEWVPPKRHLGDGGRSIQPHGDGRVQGVESLRQGGTLPSLLHHQQLRLCGWPDQCGELQAGWSAWLEVGTPLCQGTTPPMDSGSRQ